MNSKSHLYISLVKSAIRMFGAIITIYTGNVYILAYGFLVAEGLGIMEEIFDYR